MSDNTNKDNLVELKQPPHIFTEASLQVYDIPFTQISNEFIRNNKLTAEARFLLIYLISFAPGWSFNDPTIRKDLGVGRDKLERMFKELRLVGYVKNVVIRGANGVVGSKRIFSRVPEFLGVDRDPDNKDVDTIPWSPENQGPRSSGPRNQGLYKNNNSKKNNIKNNNKKIYKKDFDKEFDEFWTWYPKHADKKEAKKQFDILLNKDYENFEKIMAGVKSYHLVCKWKMTDKKYIKGPASWLNKERFNDEYETEEQLREEAKRTNKPNGGKSSNSGVSLGFLSERVQQNLDEVFGPGARVSFDDFDSL